MDLGTNNGEWRGGILFGMQLAPRLQVNLPMIRIFKLVLFIRLPPGLRFFESKAFTMNRRSPPTRIGWWWSRQDPVTTQSGDGPKLFLIFEG